jgi:hypothetical protein
LTFGRTVPTITKGKESQGHDVFATPLYREEREGVEFGGCEAVTVAEEVKPLFAGKDEEDCLLRMAREDRRTGWLSNVVDTCANYELNTETF